MSIVLAILRVGRLAVPLGIAGAWLASTGTPPHGFTARDKAYYAAPEVVNFVRPGLTMKIVDAEIAADGTIRVRFRLSDPKGLPLDMSGVTTPGPVTVSFVAAYIPNGERQHRAYSTRVFTNSKTGATVTDPWVDAGGTFAPGSVDGEYVYTFATKAPNGYDRTVTHTIGGQASRDLTEFGMSKYADNSVFNFVPDGSPVTVVRDVVRTETCNARCHDPLAVHGSNRRKVELCVLCHQPQNQDPYGGSLSFPVMIHRLHRGADLPSVKAGGKLLLNNQDFSDIVFPAGVRNCEVCHDPKSGAAQADAWLKPNRAACGACHDDVNFATGQNHLDLPQISDNMCGTCHIPQGELEFDASVSGAHLDPRFSRSLAGVVFDIMSIDNGAAGKKPSVTFSVKDNSGAAIPLSKMDRVTLVLSGPTTDYTGMISEAATSAQGSDGRYTYTFNAAIPADAAGTFAMGIEGYRSVTLMPGTVKQQTIRETGMNKVKYFSVDGSPVKPRRTVVMVKNCNQCHLKLEMHGGIRNDTEHCVQCHNVNQTDAAQRPKAMLPAETIAFKTMVHRIHTGEDLKTPYTIYGFNSTPTDFTEVVFPGDRRDCAKCHVGNSYQIPLPAGVSNVANPRGQVDPMGPVSAACMGCHTGSSVASHVIAMTTSAGESCDVCHGTTAEFSVDRVHAR